jgi:para-aminobenzoate synthetase component 1
MPESLALVGEKLFSKPIKLVTNPADITTDGNWVVLARFESDFRAVQFAETSKITELKNEVNTSISNWSSSLDQVEYMKRVLAVQEAIKAGRVYQVNLCRILTASVDARPSASGLYQKIAKHHPTKFASFIDLQPGELDAEGIWFVSASPELFLKRDKDKIWSAPIKGTAVTADAMLEKDYAENVMITDMVRNDLGAIAQTGSVKVDELLKLESIPGLVQLVSTVSAILKEGIGWAEIFKATFPPASVTGAPKSTALEVIQELETSVRSAYCGSFGYIQGDLAEFSVGIRSFEYRWGQVRFGTGAGITFGSDPEGEWQETELKAARLIELASSND